MKKNQESDVGKASGVVWKMWLTMKLLFCFLLIGFSTVYGNAFSQVKISISVNEVSLQEVFEKLTEQTGYHFVYSNEMLQRTGKVSVDMQDCDCMPEKYRFMVSVGRQYHCDFSEIQAT